MNNSESSSMEHKNQGVCLYLFLLLCRTATTGKIFKYVFTHAFYLLKNNTYHVKTALHSPPPQKKRPLTQYTISKFISVWILFFSK